MAFVEVFIAGVCGGAGGQRYAHDGLVETDDRAQVLAVELFINWYCF